MPLIIAGLSWLAGILGTAFVAFVGWMGAWVTKRIALTIAAVAAFAVLSLGIVTSIEALFSGVIGAFPVAANIGLVLPDDFAASIGIYTSGRILYWVYSVNWLIIRMRLM